MALFPQKCLTMNEPLQSPFNASIVISKKRPLWSCHLGLFFIFSFECGKVVFLNTYSNYLKTAANSNDQFQHQDLDLLCLSFFGLLLIKVVSRTVSGNAGFSDVKTLTVQCWDFRTIRLIFMNKPQYLSTFYMPPDPNSMQSSPDSLLASLQPNNQEYLKQASLQSVGSDGEGLEG